MCKSLVVYPCELTTSGCLAFVLPNQTLIPPRLLLFQTFVLVGKRRRGKRNLLRCGG